MRVYVAARFTEKGRARGVMSALKQRGWSVTHDWTLCDDSGMSGAVRRGYRAMCATADLLGVMRAELFVLLYHPGSRNALVELGAALGAKVPVVVVGAPDDHDLVFIESGDVARCDDDEALLDMADAGELARLAAWCGVGA